jgi:8-oxo-dGTP diphosphatase
MKIRKTEINITHKAAFKNAKRIIFDAFLKTSEKTLRFKFRQIINSSHKNKIKSLAFSASLNPVDSFPYAIASKIAAQEVFRYLQDFDKPVLKKIVFILPPDAVFKVFKRNIIDYLGHLVEKAAQGPFITVDGIISYKKGIVLIERSNPPLGFALPGGFVDYGESIEEAVKREVKEETNLDFTDFKQFRVYSAPKRDPRFHTVSVVFAGKGKGRLQAASDAKSAKVFRLNSLPAKIAFDHRAILKDYISAKPR